MILKLTRPDGETVYIPSEAIVTWHKAGVDVYNNSLGETQINLSTGMQIVNETCDHVYRMVLNSNG